MPLDWKDRKGRFPIHSNFDGVSGCSPYRQSDRVCGFSEVFVFFLGEFDTSVESCFVFCSRVLTLLSAVSSSENVFSRLLLCGVTVCLKGGRVYGCVT